MGKRRITSTLTVGEAAALCGVCSRTISKWYDAGRLKGFRIPGSDHRRILRDSLLRLMAEAGIPALAATVDAPTARAASAHAADSERAAG